MSEEGNEETKEHMHKNRLAMLVESLDSHLDNFKTVIGKTYEHSEVEELEVLDEMIENMEELSNSLDQVSNKLDVENYYEEG